MEEEATLILEAARRGTSWEVGESPYLKPRCVSITRGFLGKPHTVSQKTQLCRWTGNATTPHKTILGGKSSKFSVWFVDYSLFAKKQDSLKEDGPVSTLEV